MTPPTPRHATLEVRPTHGSRPEHFVILTAVNGEPLLHGETHPHPRYAVKSREACLYAMADVLRQEGWEVTEPIIEEDHL